MINLELTEEERALLDKFNTSVDAIEDLIVCRKIKKTKKSPTPMGIVKYEIAHNTCSLCGSIWVEMFNMEKYTDSSLRSKERVYIIPDGSKVEYLRYKHKHCRKCERTLMNWEKEDIIKILLNDRQTIK